MSLKNVFRKQQRVYETLPDPDDPFFSPSEIQQLKDKQRAYRPLPPQPDLEHRYSASTSSSASSLSKRSEERVDLSERYDRGQNQHQRQRPYRPEMQDYQAYLDSQVNYNPFEAPPPAPAIHIEMPTKGETCAAYGHDVRRGLLRLSHECRRCGARVKR